MTKDDVGSPQDYAALIPARMQKTIFLVFILVWFAVGFGIGYLTKMFL